MLLPDAPAGRLLLDHEPQRPGADEVDTALRLWVCVLAAYPRAFDLVLGDGLYAEAPCFNFLLAHHKHALVVLKDARRNLYQDVAGLFDQVRPQPGRYRSRACRWWDFPDLGSWPQVQGPVRVIRSLETASVRRQLDQQAEPQSSDWIWATTLPEAPSAYRARGPVRPPALGSRELWLQRAGPRVARRSPLHARPERHRMPSARGLSRVQPVPCFLRPESQASRSPGHNATLLGSAHDGRAPSGGDSPHPATLTGLRAA